MRDSDGHPHSTPGDAPEPDAATVQRAVILQLLSTPEEEGLHPVELRARLADIPIDAIAAALLSLERACVIRLINGLLLASAPARRLDRLGLIAV